MSLYGCGLIGPLPNQGWCDLKNLEVLDVSGNALEGVLPHCFSNLTSLRELDISRNHFQIPFSFEPFANLSNLKFFWSNENKMFPNSLNKIDLSNNKLHGKLPRWIGNALFLERLALSNNGFEGSIPMEFYKLNRLEFLDLSQNHLFGSIPSCFNPPNIEHVHLYGNRLRGPLLLAFHNSSSLVTLDLRGNNLVGNIPKWIDPLSSLSVLLLKDNHFHGKVPIQLCKLHSLSIIDLSQNMFSGPIPSCLGNLSLPMQTKKILDSTLE
ncbi:hypothetical protein Goshw_023914 [Gossypium schwendimanii]|uniref:Leucine-rich repeat-containing N-terminal plant-type domain-containing protein n=1 Tax=Gossypium schwendimanii TaxID=34291 RepID=A0A7J9N491_GOSSC|nr:hypothetical protein [Gossypium schwendimanii]